MKDYASRRRLIYLYQYLRKYTDSEHPVSTNELISILHSKYHIEADRNVISRDFEVLTELCRIKVKRSSQNLYYYDGWLFAGAELRLLIDAVSSSRFITEKDSQKLISRLKTMSSPSMRENMQRNVYVTGRIKSRNEFNYRIVDALNTAINKRVQVQFRYSTFDSEKHKVLRHEGGTYTVSPYALIWDGDFYYLIGYCTSHKTVQNFRVDRIYRTPKVLKRQAVPAPAGFSVVEYQKKSFRMYSTAEAQEITLLCENGMMDAVIDQFGQDVDTETKDEDHFMVRATVYPGPTFYRWVFGFAGAIQILSPACVSEEYSWMLQKAQMAQKAGENQICAGFDSDSKSEKQGLCARETE